MSSLALAAVTPAHLARQVIAQHSKSFALASRLLPTRARTDATVLYAWCRRVDDAVDNAAAERDVLAQLSHDLEAAYRGDTQEPLLATFGDVARARNIPRSYPMELLRGMAMDLEGTRYATVDDLFAYAWRVAGVVGLMMSHVLGIDDDSALVPAAHLGIAMQLTNICRDVAEDWQRDRLYLPDDVLARHGGKGLAHELGGPLPVSANPALRGAVRDLLELADRYYRSADRGLVALPWRAAFAIDSARAIYAAIGDELARRDYDVTAGRAVVTKRRKLVHVAAAALRMSARGPQRAVRALGRRHHGTPMRILELADVPRA
jgi:15-cis-phytoene synthase